MELRTDKRVWVADRVALLNKFEKEVSDGTWKKMPYKTWRMLAHSTSKNLTIIREPHMDLAGNWIYLYTVDCDSLTTPSSYQFLSEDNNSFGAFLDVNFERPSLNSKEEATATMAIDFINDPYTISGSNLFISASSDPVWNTVTYTYTTPNDVRNIIDDYMNDKNKKENNKMANSMFNFDFGPVSGNQFRMSPYGLAVRTDRNGWIAYNGSDLIDVDAFNFDISKMIYKMPVALAQVHVGDILIHGGKPVFVRSVSTTGTISVIDYANASVIDILPVKSPFGFNFFTKICPLFNVDQTNATADNPFGNMLPFLIMNQDKDNGFDPAMFFMISNMNGGNMDFTSNPMMLYLLMNDKNKDLLPFLMMAPGMANGAPLSQKATI